MTMSEQQSDKIRHDPIHYLRGDNEPQLHRQRSMNDMRRIDSDDEGPSSPTSLALQVAGTSSNASAEDPVFLAAITEVLRSTSMSTKEKTEQSILARESSGIIADNATETEQTSQSERNTSKKEKKEEEVVLPHRAYRKQSSVIAPPARARPDPTEAWPYRETLSFTRSLVFYGAGSITAEHERACAYVQTARAFRQSYFGGNHIVEPHPQLLSDRCRLSYGIGREGVAEIYHNIKHPTINLVQVPNVDQFQKDYHKLVEVTSEGVMRSFCFQRLQILSTSYKMHTTLNSTVEMEEQSNLLGTDFYRTMKVDNHIHAAAAPSAKQFVQFVRDKLETEPDTIVTSDKVKRKNPITNEEEEVVIEKTLAQVYEDAGLDMDHLTIDAFNVLADYSVYQRFDNFNSKYSPFKLADMRRIFLKTTNTNDGRYFAELLKIVLNRHELSKGHNSACEMRLSIYGMERHEWYDLAKWMITDWQHPDFPGTMISSNNRWLIQVPRLWRIYSQKPIQNGQLQRTFLEMIENLFVPLFDATLDPDSHPEIAEAMKHIAGFDSVDDEGALEDGSCSCQRPHQWTKSQNPSYWWQLYFIWANLQVLNRLRTSLGLNTFSFRPHAGETGDPMHLAATYMLCDSINHGILLDAQVSLQYLYYLDQVGLSISPLSNNFLFRKIAENPFPKFFRRGLNVTISTDDPLLFHLSDDALLEEYSVARATFDLSMTDMMEIARNSVLQSGFEESFKEKWLGENYRKGQTFCDENITHVPLIRAKFRAEHLAIEHMLVHLIAAGKGDRVLQEMKVQFGLARDAHRDILFENFEEVPSFPERGQL